MQKIDLFVVVLVLVVSAQAAVVAYRRFVKEPADAPIVACNDT